MHGNQTYNKIRFTICVYEINDDTYRADDDLLVSLAHKKNEESNRNRIYMTLCVFGSRFRIWQT